jgi:hypothetical protein
MPKSKRAPALFELINTRTNGKSGKLAIPKWFKGAPTAPQPEAAPTPVPDEPSFIAPAPVAATPPAPPAAAATRTAGPPPASSQDVTPSHPPVLKIRGSRLELSLNPANVVIAAGVLVLIVLCTYLIGQGIGSKSKPGQALQLAGAPANDDVRQALDQPANAKVLEPPRRVTLMGARTPAEPSQPPAAPPAQSPETTAASRGPNRIVVENFKLEHLKAAEHVRDWLASNYGLRTELHRAGDNIWLVTLDGFDLSKPGEKEALAKRVEDIKSLGGACGRELAKCNLPIYLLKSPSPRRFD